MRWLCLSHGLFLRHWLDNSTADGGSGSLLQASSKSTSAVKLLTEVCTQRHPVAATLTEELLCFRWRCSKDLQHLVGRNDHWHWVSTVFRAAQSGSDLHCTWWSSHRSGGLTPAAACCLVPTLAPGHICGLVKLVCVVDNETEESLDDKTNSPPAFLSFRWFFLHVQSIGHASISWQVDLWVWMSLGHCDPSSIQTFCCQPIRWRACLSFFQTPPTSPVWVVVPGLKPERAVTYFLACVRASSCVCEDSKVAFICDKLQHMLTLVVVWWCLQRWAVGGVCCCINIFNETLTEASFTTPVLRTRARPRLERCARKKKANLENLQEYLWIYDFSDKLFKLSELLNFSDLISELSMTLLVHTIC